jgi:hypothetical protein
MNHFADFIIFTTDPLVVVKLAKFEQNPVVQTNGLRYCFVFVYESKEL